MLAPAASVHWALEMVSGALHDSDERRAFVNLRGIAFNFRSARGAPPLARGVPARNPSVCAGALATARQAEKLGDMQAAVESYKLASDLNCSDGESGAGDPLPLVLTREHGSDVSTGAAQRGARRKLAGSAPAR